MEVDKQVLVEAGKPLKVYINVPKMPVHNPKCTKHSIDVYSPPITLSFFKERKYLWCKHTTSYLKIDGQEVYLALPPLSIVFYHFSSGSWKHTYVSFSKLFYVSETPKSETLLDSDLSLSHENLLPLPDYLKNFEKIEVEMQVEGYSSSQRFPNVNVNAYRILRLVRGLAQPQPAQTQSTPSISGRVSSIFISGGEER